MRHPTSSSLPVESEWQFEASGFEEVEHRIRTLPVADGVTFGPAETVRQTDVYFDTRDWSLFRADYGFRIRGKGHTHEATLKQVNPPKDGLAVRREMNQPAIAPTPAGVLASPGPVTERLRLLTTARSLRPIAELRTTRRRVPILWNGKVVGEIALDRTLCHGAAGPHRLTRIEVEVSSRFVARLRPFVERLRVEAGLTPAARSKLEWALETQGRTPDLTSPLGPTNILPTMSVGAAAYAILRRQTAAVIQHEPGTRLGDDPEHLHDMRVATRRLRAALRVFADQIPARDRERLRRELRDLGQALGAVRDLDVQIEQVHAWKPALLTVPPPALDPFLELLREERAAARVQLLEFLDSPRYRKLRADLRQVLRRGPLRLPRARLAVRLAGPELVRRGRKRVLRQARAMSDPTTTGKEPTSADYHRLRILGKRWRYTLEFLEPVYGPPAKPLIQALSELQDILGLHQDAQVLLEELPALARRETLRLPEATRMALGEVAQLYAARAAAQRALLPDALRKIRGKRWKTMETAMEDALQALNAEEAAEAKAAAETVTRPRARVPRAARAPRAAWSRAHAPSRKPPLGQK